MDRVSPRQAHTTPPAHAFAPRRFSWWRQGLRLVRYRLVIPLLRSRHSPEHTARGVTIGVIWAMTPLVGIQMLCVLLTWVVTTRLFSWHFNLVLGLAWTWITNVFTVLPFYYTFYVTGQVMLGHWDDLSGYDSFVALWQGTFSEDAGFWEVARGYAGDIVQGWGLPLVVGSLPWVLLTGVSSYIVTLRLSRRRQERLEARQLARSRAAIEADGHDPSGGRVSAGLRTGTDDR
ncbi:DUF2062 domain-containing protein [Roseospira visakhapatnamensis]|uniref:DUF2062 domain-containing protein n=1 Tax=Roseospira visakhapatnamensis TaxID=390880 RepID=A0A7W6W915_9PROT|nr:DUF2062 domain-containing protein [Roseospira visakhapatnamensis]MBB4265429.1 hypothetical protein [Roseospira visakhapatnamensis]